MEYLSRLSLDIFPGSSAHICDIGPSICLFPGSFKLLFLCDNQRENSKIFEAVGIKIKAFNHRLLIKVYVNVFTTLLQSCVINLLLNR